MSEIRSDTIAEMERILPVLERAEADPDIWHRLTAGTGIATLNGFRTALRQAKVVRRLAAAKRRARVLPVPPSTGEER
jgi:hypothetical protein